MPSTLRLNVFVFIIASLSSIPLAQADSACPRNVIVLGDSFAQDLHATLRLTYQHGAVNFVDASKVSSGLTRLDFSDTHSRFEASINSSQTGPGGLAVIWLGANDNQSLTDRSAHILAAPGSDAWQAGYYNRIVEIADTCRNRGLTCYWLVPVASTEPNHTARMGQIRQLIFNAAQSETYRANLHAVDVWSLRNKYPGGDFAHPSQAGFNYAAQVVAGAISETSHFDIATGHGTCN